MRYLEFVRFIGSESRGVPARCWGGGAQGWCKLGLNGDSVSGGRGKEL